MTGLETLLPAFGYAGGLGVLLYLVIYLLRSLRADRIHYVEQLAKKQAEVDATHERLDDAREARRAAEDKMADMSRALGDLAAKVERLEAEVARLRGAVHDAPEH